jgi:hypothetical protein
VETLGAGHTWTAVAFANQGAATLLAGRSTEGRITLDRAFDVLRDHPIALTTDLKEDLEKMAKALDERGHGEIAARYRSLLDSRPPGP